MTHELTPHPESRDITPYTEPPHMYPPYSVRYQDDGRGFDLHAIWGFARRNWWIMAIFLLLGLAGAATYNRLARPVYQASATIQVQTEATAMDPTGFQLFPGSSDATTEIEVLRSRTLAEKVVDSLQLQIQMVHPKGLPRSDVFARVRTDRSLRPGRYVLERREGDTFDLLGTEGQPLGISKIGQPVTAGGVTLTLSPEIRRHDRVEFVLRGHQAAVSRVASHLVVGVPGRDPRAGIIQLTYRDSDPQLVAAVLNTLAEVFIDHRLQEQRQNATNTVVFLRGQLDTLNVQLRDAELQLRQYRESAQVVDLATEGSSKISQLAALQAQHDQISVERNSLLRLRTGLGSGNLSDPLAPSPYRRLVGYPGLMGNASLTDMISSLTALETERSELLERRQLEDPEVQSLTQQIRNLETQMQDHIDTYLESLDIQLTSLNSVLGRSAGELYQIPRKEFELAQLLRLTELLRGTFVLLQTRLKEAEITQAVEEPNVSVVDPAISPRKPIAPRRTWNLLMGVLVGLAFGVGVSYAREFLDTRIHTREDLRNVAGVPVLGLIPRIGTTTGALPLYTRRLLKSGDGNGSAAEGKGPPSSLVAEHDRTSAVSEAFRSLRTNITFSSTVERISKVFMLTSPTPQDGKTTTASNLAVTFAQQGLHVLLVDGDMRRGILHKLFRVPRTPGLSNILVENVDFERAIHWVQLEQGTEIDILPTGTVPPNPAELISSPRMQWLIDRLQERYDAIVFDTPPLTLVTDAAVLASYAHTVLLVARANQTEQGAISFAMEQLRNVGAPVRGAVLNDVEFGRYGRYSGKHDYYGHSYGYGPEE